METFTWDPRRWLIARVFGRNPLLRPADRIEALVVLVALVAALVAVPVAGVVGAATYGARDRSYAQQARERHPVRAQVTDAHPGELGATVAQIRWPAAGGEQRSGTLRLDDPVKPGEGVDIWADGAGNLTAPPTPAWHAVGAAAGTVVLTLLCASAVLGLLLAAVVYELDRVREARWERELRTLVQDGGRTNRP
ncbi:hypothetical protein [Mycobacterium servetii]|uniref:Transmembrane protein n=1 Tax=Mycobacterium servetii TaxID=3237418 RepID=A0ABV4C534_9MYCO